MDVNKPILSEDWFTGFELVCSGRRRDEGIPGEVGKG